MACKRSAVRSRLAPPVLVCEIGFFRPASPSSRGLGHIPFTDATGVRIPVGTPIFKRRQAGGPNDLTVTRSLLLQAARTSDTRAALASFPLDSHDKRVARAPPPTGVLPQRAALDEIQDVTVGRVLRALGELGVFGCREFSLEAVE